MTRYDKLLLKILRGTSDANIPFKELCVLLVYLGFEERIRGSHHILTRPDVDEILNLQPAVHGKALQGQVSTQCDPEIPFGKQLRLNTR